MCIFAAEFHAKVKNGMLLAIKRAEIFSPNSIDKDTAIIERVAQLLNNEGLDTRIASESERLTDVDASLFVSMGRKPETLDFLKGREAKGAIVVNSAKAVELCCHRHKMRGILQSAGIPLAPLEGNNGYWVKRADGVATSREDVKYVKTRKEAEAYEQWLREERGAKDVEVTAHVVGDVIKFYGVRHTDFFRCYYSSEDGKSKFGDESVNGLPHHYIYNKVELHSIADRAAETVGVDIYGGDVIVRPDGSMAIVDLNDWPSFSRCREEAAKAIADMITNKKENKAKE